METPFKTANPSQFKLRLVWGMETGHKLVAEFSDCSWLPSQGDVMILPVDQFSTRKAWNQYKVANVIYDFEYQITRVVCAALTPGKAQTETHSHKPLTTTQRLQTMEKWGEAIAANSPKLSFETVFNEKDLLEGVDEELAILKRKLALRESLKSAQQQALQKPKEADELHFSPLVTFEDVEDELEKLKKEMTLPRLENQE